MKINQSTVSLTVTDLEETEKFLTDFFGFSVVFTAEGFTALMHRDTELGIALHKRGLEVLPPEQRDVPTQAVTLVFTVDDVEAEERWLREAGANVTLELTQQPWGEKLFQVTDGNGIIVQLLEWVTEPSEDTAA